MNKRVLSLFLGLASVTFAGTWTVTTVQDTVDPNDGVMSLREAIMAANANVDATGRCQGINNITFSLSGTNAIATYGTVMVPYYKLKINYPDPDYANLMGLSVPVPTPLPRVRCPINLDGYSQPGTRPSRSAAKTWRWISPQPRTQWRAMTWNGGRNY
jgi:CSLREA domain-containing protein